MKNKDIRLMAAGAGVKLWEIAQELGITDGNLSRKLRNELSEEKKEEIISVINRISKRNEIQDNLSTLPADRG